MRRNAPISANTPNASFARAPQTALWSDCDVIDVPAEEGFMALRSAPRVRRSLSVSFAHRMTRATLRRQSRSRQASIRISGSSSSFLCQWLLLALARGMRNFVLAQLPLYDPVANRTVTSELRIRNV